MLSNRLFQPQFHPVPFWIDTLCVPLDKATRKWAVESIELIFKSAPKVLVLDNALMKMRSRDMTPEEVGLQILCSAWPRRLWTLQEGLFQNRVHYRFADAVQVYPYLDEAIRKKHAFPGRQRLIPHDHFLHRYLDKPPNCEGRSAPLKVHAHKALSFWPRISSFFKEMHVLYHWEGFNNGTYLRKAIRSVMTRTTSKLEDESLVFTGITTLLTGSKGKLHGVEPDERFRKFFQPRWGYGIVPSEIIFLDQRRYNEEGSRWIPKSFLSQASPWSPLIPMSFADAQTFSRGIKVDYPGILLTSPGPGARLLQEFIVEISGVDYRARIHEAG
jgi:hypothetical protein